MAIFTFILGLVFVAAGAGALVASFDLLPTEVGLLYAACGTMAVCAGGVTLAIGALIHRVGGLEATIQRAQGREVWQTAAAASEETLALREVEIAEVESDRVARTEIDEAAGLEAEPEFEPNAKEGESIALEDDEINENRSGHLPTMAEIEHALAEPEPAPALVGRYSAGGAHYMIFSDGSIEAETEGGAFKFSSMSEFKAYLAGARG